MLRDLGVFLRKDLSLIFFIYSIMLLVFVYGILVGRYHLFPYHVIANGIQGILDWKNSYRHNLKILPEKHIGEPRKRDRQFFRSGDAWAGVTLVTSFIKNRKISNPGLLLLDMDGNIINQWVVSANKIFPETKTKRLDWDVLITGAALLSNGDVIFNINYVGIVKMDWCSNILWKAPLRTHHNIFIDENNNIWTAGKKSLKSKELLTQYPKSIMIKDLDVILKLSPEGQLLKEIDLLDVIIKSDLKGTLFANGQQHLHHMNSTKSFEFTHLNDVEVLRKDIAKEYPIFETGDIMVSLRNLNLIMVLDPKTSLAKWWMLGPFLRQHDPDFDGQGGISIFDNMGGGPKDNIGFASRIISIEPTTRDLEITYRANPPEDFYTHERGSHQILPNGNMLITETFEGRIFEVNPEGIVVWQYLTKWDNERVIHPYQAERYEDIYSRDRQANCY